MGNFTSPPRVPVLWALNIFSDESTELTGLSDPVTVDKPGVFVNPELQAAYIRLVTQGSLSLTEALQAGATIETLDIEDLDASLGISAHSDIARVVQNLLLGSQKHLAAFARLLAK